MTALAVLIFSAAHSFAGTWARTYGTAYDDNTPSVIETTDGDFLAIGESDPSGSGQTDAHVFKVDVDGNLLWQKLLQGSSDENFSTLVVLPSGNYLSSGRTASFGQGNDDAWLFEFDPSGKAVWQKTLGGTQTDRLSTIINTSDGGYALAGRTDSFGAGLDDMWVIRLDSNRNFLWQKTCGGTGTDSSNFLHLIGETPGGGLIVGGESDSFGSSTDVWIVKLNAKGGTPWRKRYGGNLKDVAKALTVMSTGEIVVAGWTRSYGAGLQDNWILKLNANGTIQWEKTIGGTGDENPRDLTVMPNGDIIVVGDTTSFGGGGQDGWIVRMNSTGTILWRKSYGADGDEAFRSILQTSDGGILVSGSTTSSIGAGLSDAWLLKLNSDGTLDETCSFIADTDASEFTTSTKVTDTDMTPEDTAVTMIDSTATEGALTLSTRVQCAGCSADAYENDGTCLGSPNTINGGDTQMRNFCADTEDWLEFNACSGRNYDIETSNLGFSTDTVIELYDTNCSSLLASDDNSGPGLASLLNWTAPADGVYHLRLLQFDATTGSDHEYDLTLTGDTTACISPPTEVSPPGSAEPLLFTSNTAMQWENAAANGSDTFNLYRGDVSGLLGGDYGSCLQSGIVTNGAPDAAAPPTGATWFYLVTGVNAADEGPIGDDSAGSPRVNGSPCS